MIILLGLALVVRVCKATIQDGYYPSYICHTSYIFLLVYLNVSNIYYIGE